MTHQDGVPWKKLSAEGVVIVLSILLAFAIDAGWDALQDRKEEAALVSSLVSEFEATGVVLRGTINASERSARVLQDFLEGNPADVGPMPADSAFWTLMALWGGSTNELPSGVLTSAISSGSLALIRDADLTTTLAAWPGRVENIRERAQVMREQEAAFTEHLVQHREVATVLPDAVSEISAVIASGQPGRPVVEAEEALALLRSIKGDSLAMRRLSVKLWMTTLYVGQLKVLETDLRAIEADLSGTGRTPPS